MWAQVINIILGLLLLFVPAVIDVDKLTNDNLCIVGTLVITFAIIAIWEVNRNVRWFNIPAGTWLIFSSLVLGLEGPITVVNGLFGILIITCSLFKGKIEQRYGGGWRSLLHKEPPHVKEVKP